MRQPLSGWLGHAAPFAFESRYRPADGIARNICGTPPVLSLAALDAGLVAFDGVDMAAVRRKSVALCDLFIELMEATMSRNSILASPRRAEDRGSQVSFRHPQGYAIMQALIARQVIGDFRAPDILRFGFAPLYQRYARMFGMQSRPWPRSCRAGSGINRPFTSGPQSPNRSDQAAGSRAGALHRFPGLARGNDTGDMPSGRVIMMVQVPSLEVRTSIT